ncbi:MAG: Na+/H+ antiporter subunit E [Myxococcota bacterium]
MSRFFFILVSGVVWMALTADLDLGSFVVGGLIGATMWTLEGAKSHRPFGPRRAGLLALLGSRLILVFLWELLVANLQQTRLVLSPRIEIQPGWIEVPCSLETPAMRALLGTLLTLTPGSLTYEEKTDEDGRWTLRMHLLDARTGEREVQRSRDRFEGPLRRMENL